MSSTISGNVGGSSFQNALVQCLNILTKAVVFYEADSSGNYSFAGLAAGTYTISATYPAYVYYHPIQVIADGSTTYSGTNLSATALNASNVGV